MNTTALVTGVAGFIGSHLAQRLIEQRFDVIGIDSFGDYYPRYMKEGNLKTLLDNTQFTFIEGNLLSNSLSLSAQANPRLENIDYIFHQAALPGVRKSWEQFQAYVDNNILATHKLLEFVKGLRIKKLVFASSSSVYGNAETLPITENSPLEPVSPYGMTKLAAENLCRLYWHNFGVPVVILRYFTVYGPRQRPDMAFHKFIRAILDDQQIEIFGDGRQTRDFTFVSDVVEATISAASAPPGEIFNIGGETRIALTDAVALIENITGSKARIKWIQTQKGDVRNTWANIDMARRLLGYQPRVPLEHGLWEETSWLRQFVDKGGER